MTVIMQYLFSQIWTPSLFLSVLTANFHQASAGIRMDFIGDKDDGGGGDNWNYKMCKAPV